MGRQRQPRAAGGTPAAPSRRLRTVRAARRPRGRHRGPPSGGPRHRYRNRRLRRAGAGVAALAATVATSTVAGPGDGAAAGEPCDLPRHEVHHSLGVDSWNPAYPRPEGELDAVMLFLSFPDSTPEVDPDEIAADYFPQTAEFFERASYGRFQLNTELTDDWVEMPRDSDTYAIARDWEPDRRAAFLRDALDVLAPLVEFDRYEIVYVVSDPDAPGVNPDATKVVNFDRPVRVGDGELRRLVTLFERRPPDRNVLAHETGHVLDLPDLYDRPEDGDGDWDTHVGDWDLMGSQFGLAPEPFAWHKWKLGWLDREHLDCVTDAGTTEHILQPLAAPLGPDGPGGPSGDTRMVAVRTGPDEVLVLEARAAVGNDVSLCTEGVLLYRVRGDVPSTEGPVRVVDGNPDSSACHGRSVQPDLADAPLAEGESHHLPDDGLAVRVGDRTADGGWRVTVVRE